MTRAIVVRSNAASVVVESEIVAAMGSSDFLEAGFTGAEYGSAFRRVLPDIAIERDHRNAQDAGCAPPARKPAATIQTLGTWRQSDPQRTSEVRFASDSPLEGDGFEPSVPLYILTVSDPFLSAP